MVEISQFKNINSELEQKFLHKIQELQNQHLMFQTSEKDLNKQILHLKESNRELQRRYTELEEESKELQSVKEKWSIFKSSQESKYDVKVTQLEEYHQKQLNVLSAQYESKMVELKSIKESGTDKERN